MGLGELPAWAHLRASSQTGFTHAPILTTPKDAIICLKGCIIVGEKTCHYAKLAFVSCKINLFLTVWSNSSLILSV